MKGLISTSIRALFYAKKVVLPRMAMAVQPLSMARPSLRVGFFSTAPQSAARAEISVGLIPSNVNVAEVRPLFLKTFQDTYPHLFSEEHRQTMFESNKLAADLKAENTDYLYVKEGKNYIGYAKLRYQDSKTILEKFYLLKEHQDKGLGKKLLQACCEQALKRQQETMELFVGEGNSKAIAFYREWGFSPAGATEKEFAGARVKGMMMHLYDIQTLHQRLVIPDLRYGIYLH